VIIMTAGDPPLLVGTLHGAIECPHPEGNRLVRLSYERYAHILMQRNVDAPLVFRMLRDVIAAPTHCGKRTSDPRRPEVYRLLPGEQTGVCVSLKFLPGETWINTAIPFGMRSLLRYLRSGRLRPIG